MAFSADWLALREPADRAARDPNLLRAAVRAAGPAPVIVDLGCGTGATWRAMAQHLPATTRWRFVDSDPALLAEARAATHGAAEIVEADLNRLETLPLDGATLVTASALLDLVSEAWIMRFAALGVPFYAALSYNGEMTWTPSDPRDDPVTLAFNRHQGGDKGFGPSLGPDAAATGARIFEAAGFYVRSADSPWQLDAAHGALHGSLVEGIAAAAAEAGAEQAVAWGRDRIDAAAQASCRIGHTDLLALPPGVDAEGARHV